MAGWGDICGERSAWDWKENNLMREEHDMCFIYTDQVESGGKCVKRRRKLFVKERSDVFKDQDLAWDILEGLLDSPDASLEQGYLSYKRVANLREGWESNWVAKIQHRSSNIWGQRFNMVNVEHEIRLYVSSHTLKCSVLRADAYLDI